MMTFQEREVEEDVRRQLEEQVGTLRASVRRGEALSAEAHARLLADESAASEVQMVSKYGPDCLICTEFGTTGPKFGPDYVIRTEFARRTEVLSGKAHARLLADEGDTSEVHHIIITYSLYSVRNHFPLS